MELRSRFENLPARPPTPPKESGISLDTSELDLTFLVTKPPKTALDTPNESPCSTTESLSKSSDRPSKRVDFQLGNSKLANVTTSSPHEPGSVRSQPPSRDTRPIKSILKATPLVSSEVGDTAQEPRDFPRMLDDIARQLAASSAGSRLDAYVQLNNCLKTYKNMPEQQALRDKMPLLASFIERDIQETQVEEGARSTQLATEMVRLVTTLLWSPTMGDVLPEAFQCFILDKSIAVAGSSNVPKVLVNQYLHLLGVQSFRPKIMNVDRTNRIITNLGKVMDHVKGKQVVAHKLEIYKKLITQSRSVMHARFRDWHECMFHGLIAANHEIRVRALSLAYEAGVAFGASEQVTKAVINLFNHKVESKDSKQRYGDLFIARFQERLAIKEERQQVPQIWAAVILFLRNRPLERWAFTSDWLRILQQCFNTGDTELRLQANRAWIRLIYVVDPCTSTSDSMAILLRTPLEKQFDRLRATDKETKKLKASVVATYATLLYYAFRPNSSWDIVERFWSQYIAHFFVAGPNGTPALDVSTGTSVLSTLFCGDQQKSWSATRASESTPVKMDELPRLDPKWIRARAGSVLATLDKILLNEEWWTGDIDQAPAHRIWQAFTKALGEASRKEIKVSTETMHAIAEIVSTLVRFFIRAALWTVPSETVYLRLTALVKTAKDNIGYLPFTEQRLVRVAPEQFTVVAAPGGRMHKTSNSPISAFSALIDAVACSTGAATISQEVDRLLNMLVRSTIKAGSSRASRLSISRGISTRTALVPGENIPMNVRRYIWNTSVTMLIEDFGRVSSDESMHENSSLETQDFHNAEKLLEVGIDLGDDVSPQWSHFLDALKTDICREAGATTWMVAIFKPLATYLSDQLSNGDNAAVQRFVVVLMRSATWRNPHNTLHTPRKNISRTLGITAKQTSDAIAWVARLAGEALSRVYSEPAAVKADMQTELLEAVLLMVKEADASSFDVTIEGLELGLKLWIEDLAGHLSADSTESLTLFKTFISLWDAFLEKISSLETFTQAVLAKLAPTLTAGLTSRHRAVVNKSLEFWNSTFGCQASLEYPVALHDALLKLHNFAEVVAPGLSDAGSTPKALHTSFNYLSTPADLAELGDNALQEHCYDAPTRQTRQPLVAIAPNDSPVSTPRRPQANKLRSTPRMRHDDSQIEFAAITSSPPNIEALESQLLTEHQREVRDRQQAEAKAMFPDLRSSPRRRNQERELPRLRLRSDGELPRSDLDEPHSPTLPPPSETPFLGSSPTPSQRRLSSRDRASASARASVEAQLANLGEAGHSPRTRSSKASPTELSSELQTFGEELLALYEEPVEDIFVFPPSGSDPLPTSDNDQYVDAPSHADPSELHDDASLSSDSDDDMASEDGEHVLEESAENEPSSNVEVVQARLGSDPDPLLPCEPSQISMDNDDQQIAAQILNDIEQAHSLLHVSSAGSSSSPRSRRARSNKDASTPTGRIEKRGRGRGGQAVARVPKLRVAAAYDDDLEDCIIVASSQSQSEPSEAPHSDELPTTAQRRPVKVSPTDSSSNWPSSEAVFDVPPTPLARGRTNSRKRRQPEPVIEEPLPKRSRTLTAKAQALRTASKPRAVTPPSQESPLEPMVISDLSDSFGPPSDAAAAGSFSEATNPPASLEASGEAPKTSQNESVELPDRAPSTPRRLAISGAEFLARVRQLFEDAKHVVLGGHEDEIMTGLMDVGREVMEAKRRV